MMNLAESALQSLEEKAPRAISVGDDFNLQTNGGELRVKVTNIEVRNEKPVSDSSVSITYEWSLVPEDGRRKVGREKATVKIFVDRIQEPVDVSKWPR